MYLRLIKIDQKPSTEELVDTLISIETNCSIHSEEEFTSKTSVKKLE
jgi:hypothetical protein